MEIGGILPVGGADNWIVREFCQSCFGSLTAHHLCHWTSFTLKYLSHSNFRPGSLLILLLINLFSFII